MLRMEGGADHVQTDHIPNFAGSTLAGLASATHQTAARDRAGLCCARQYPVFGLDCPAHRAGRRYPVCDIGRDCAELGCDAVPKNQTKPNQVDEKRGA